MLSVATIFLVNLLTTFIYFLRQEEDGQDNQSALWLSTMDD